VETRESEYWRQSEKGEEEDEEEDEERERLESNLKTLG
jgi:hypothetical protein